MDRVRPRPYIWVTWLTKLLAGENKCWWAGWYKAHHKYEKTADDPERADFFREWTEKHDAIVADSVAEYRAAGYVVRVEDDASFKLSGQQADLAGKPDVVALPAESGALPIEVVDAKSGKRRASDHWQVLVYLFALPLSWLPGRPLVGRVVYRDGPEDVRPLGPRERDAIVEAVRRLASPTAPEPVPSAFECKHCDVKACTARFVAPQGDATRYF